MTLTADEIKPIVNEIIDSLREIIERTSSPWATRKSAASYCQCSIAEIDKASAAGHIKKFKRHDTPMFKKTGCKGSLDAWIETRQGDSK